MSIEQFYAKFRSALEVAGVEGWPQSRVDILLLIASSDEPPTITQIIRRPEVASPVTLHKQLHTLIGDGLVRLSWDKNDGRVKHAHLTKDGLELVADMTSWFREAA